MHCSALILSATQMRGADIINVSRNGMLLRYHYSTKTLPGDKLFVVFYDNASDKVCKIPAKVVRKYNENEDIYIAVTYDETPTLSDIIDIIEMEELIPVGI